ncbi:MAG TPA: hypothetical protein VJV23_09445 [Candidatus Polarisedimenticolia bacterium]|nr:hypothetical protein [Candidatus Polarisedimenticolia bacterium]
MKDKKLENFLQAQHVRYEILEHATAYTSQETAGTLHVKGKEFAKSVILKTGDGSMVMAVLPVPGRSIWKRSAAWSGPPRWIWRGRTSSRSSSRDASWGPSPRSGTSTESPCWWTRG